MAVDGHSGTVVDHGNGRMSRAVVLLDATGAPLLMSTVLEDVHDDINHMLQVRQVALAGDTDSVTRKATSSNLGGVTSSDAATGAQVLAAASATRAFFKFKNESDTTIILGWGITPSATAGEEFGPGQGIILDGVGMPTDEIKIYCASTNKRFHAMQVVGP